MTRREGAAKVLLRGGLAVVFLGLLSLPFTGPVIVRSVRPPEVRFSEVFEPTQRAVARGDVVSRFDVEGRVVPLEILQITAQAAGELREVAVPSGSPVAEGARLYEIEGNPEPDGRRPRSRVLAPISGLFLRPDVRVGQPVTEAMFLGVVESADHGIEAPVAPEHLYGFTDRPNEINARVQGILGEFSCDFRSLARQLPESPEGLSGDASYAIRCAIPESVRTVLGSEAELEVVAARAENVLVIPITAVEGLPPGAFVNRLGRDGVAQRIPVRLGLISETNVEILEGLDEGDRVLDPARRDD